MFVFFSNLFDGFISFCLVDCIIFYLFFLVIKFVEVVKKFDVYKIGNVMVSFV